MATSSQRPMTGEGHWRGLPIRPRRGRGAVGHPLEDVGIGRTSEIPGHPLGRQQVSKGRNDGFVLVPSTP